MQLTREQADHLIGIINDLADGRSPEPVHSARSEEPGIDWDATEIECPVDGSEGYVNTGIAKKGPNVGKPYRNFKCKKNGEHIYWDNNFEG